MKKVFISHSSYDSFLAEKLVDFLVHGVGINSESIFCSAVPGNDIPIGVNFHDYILDQLKGDNNFVVIAIISNSYYNSKYCLYELGAAWGLGGNNSIIPFLIQDMKYGHLQDFISHNQAIDSENSDDINKVIEYFRNSGEFKLRKVAISRMESERNKLIDYVKEDKQKYKDKSNNVGTKSKSMSSKYKLVVFDFDGTILQGKNYKYSWKAIWEYLNYDDKIRRSLLRKHKTDPKNYKFQDWCNECIEYFRNRDFKKEHVKKIIEDRELTLAEGFEDLVRILYELGFKIIIISGGIDTFVDEILSVKAREDYIDEIFITKFIYDKNGFLVRADAYQNKDSDSVGKTKTLESYCLQNNIRFDQVVFIGDETNDIDIAQHAGKAFVYPAKSASIHTLDLIDTFEPIFEDNIIHILPKILK